MAILNILIAGGGTGGHIYPGLAIADAIKNIGQKKSIQINVEFVGTATGLETKIIPAKGMKLHLIQSGKLNLSGRFLEKIKTLVKLPIGFIQSLILLTKLKPVYVVGVGGYASAPLLLAATLMGYKTAIWEPNAHPGLANRILSRFVKKAFVVFDEARNFLHCADITKAGMPLREEIEKAREVQLQNPSRIVENKKFTILCFGGSQGSVFLNTQISDYVLRNPNAKDVRIIHQTGKQDYQRMVEKYKGVNQVELLEYIQDMPKYMLEADLLFCRGGASTLAEASAFGVIPIVVPLPAADNHQQRNAESLVKAGAGFMLIQNEFSNTEFENMIAKVKTDPQLKAQMRQALVRLVPARSADQIAIEILKEL